MSAIFGIINKNGEAIDEAMATKMQSTLLHRAVDGQHMVIQGEAMFGHHKLIVHRRQTDEQQPFEYDDCIITCDARIDNIEALSKELDLDNNTVITDSYIILRAYKKWGNNCADRLEGEFAFAIWNKATKTYYAACDHIGFRTFYYYENADFFAFASTIKAIESIKTEPLEINEEIFLDYYTNIKHPITYDKNIHVLQSAHYLSLRGNSKLKLVRYWLAKATKKYNFKHSHEWHDCVLELTTKKIECMLDSDYPIGIMLSGGLDSSFVCAIACGILKNQNKRLHAFCNVLPEDYTGEDKDERYYIEKLNEYFDNLEVHYVTISEDIGPYSNLKEAFEQVEAPINAFHYAESALFEFAKQMNIRTLLTGYGGDMCVSSQGGVVIYQYLSQFRILQAYRLFVQRYKESKKGLFFQINHEILNHVPLIKKLKSYMKRSDIYLYYPLNRNYLRKVIKVDNDCNYMYNKGFAIRVNKGELGSALLHLTKHAGAFQLEFLSPLLSKEICNLFMDIPGEELFLNGIKRSLIKGVMANLVPKEITARTDKMPFSPDYNKRISKISVEEISHFFKDKKQIVKRIGIDLVLFQKLISKIDDGNIKSDWNINNQIFYIPFLVINAEFVHWLNDVK